MKKYARVVDNVVMETFIPPQGFELADCFTAELVAQFVEVSEEVEQNWVQQEDGTFIAPTES